MEKAELGRPIYSRGEAVPTRAGDAGVNPVAEVGAGGGEVAARVVEVGEAHQRLGLDGIELEQLLHI